MTSNDDYTYEQKKNMAGKISNMTNKDDLRAIKRIIFNENPNIMVNRESGGMLLFFQNLTPITYVKLENFLNEIAQKKNNKRANEYSQRNNIAISSSDSDNDFFNKFKYTNQEKSIIKKKEYETILNEEKKNYVASKQKNKSIFSKTCHQTDRNIANISSNNSTTNISEQIPANK